MSEEKLIKHRVLIDKYVSVDLFIPEELTALELKGLTMKANKLFNLSEVDVQSHTVNKYRIKWNKAAELYLKNNYGKKSINDLLIDINSLHKLNLSNVKLIYSKVYNMKSKGKW